MTLPEWLLLVAATAAGAAVNSVAGGGSLISWPAALAVGLPPIQATATNTVAMAPGALASAWAYRRELGDNRRLAALLAVPAATGSLLGGFVLLSTSQEAFKAVVPWLILAASGVVVGKHLLGSRLQLGTPDEGARAVVSWPKALMIALCVLGVSIYGGYFGAGLGIMFLGVLAFLRQMNIHRMNAVKTVLSGVVNGVAAVYFVWVGASRPDAAVAMVSGALLGGYGGAALARRIEARVVAVAVGLIGVGSSVYVGYQRWG